VADPVRTRRLLDELADSGRTPEEVCGDDPDLLPEVRDRWRRVGEVRAELDAWFPSPDELSATPPEPHALPSVPGYAVEAVLGRGGMGVVFRARHLALNRPVALKMVLSGGYVSPAERECLRREAELIAALRHPHIVPLFDAGDSGGRPYYTMELVEGGTLAQKLAGAPLAAKPAAALVAQLADAVHAAHQLGVVHRDLKPANVLLAADGTPKIGDFGLARRVDGGGATVTGMVVGTPSYMAPEQARGEVRSVGPATDVYGLGAILYKALTGRPPFRAATAAETVVQVLTQPPVPPSRLNSSVPRDLETICLKCLEKQPARRYATATALADDLLHFQRGEAISARPVGRLERVLRWTRRNPTAAALIVMTVLLAAVAAGVGLREWDLSAKRQTELARWSDRLAFVNRLQQDGRFAEAHATLQEAHADAPSVQSQIADARERLKLVETLDAIRLNRDRTADGGGLDYAASGRKYAEAFRSAGLGAFDDDPVLVARRLAASPVRKVLISALDDWAACAEKKERDWVLTVCRTLDPDPWRDRVRDADGWANTDAFPAIVGDADIPNQPVTLMVALGTRWRRLSGDPPLKGDPTPFLARVQRQHPTDFWVNFELGHLLLAHDPATAIGYYRAALAVRPDAAVVHANLGWLFSRLSRFEDAAHHYQRAHECGHPDKNILIYLGSCLTPLGRHAEAAKYWREALALDPNMPALRQAVRSAELKLGRAKEVCDEWKRYLASGPAMPQDHDGYAELCLFLGLENDYRSARRQLLDQFETTENPQAAERTGRACLLLPDTPEDTRRAVALIDRAMADDMRELPKWVPPYFWFAKGLAEYRLGHFDTAIDIMSKKTGGVLGPAPRLVEAMALHHLGRTADARKRYDTAITQFDWSRAKADSREAFIYHILRHESERLLLKK
jgi:tetratricopeptide (TPR) repeat protein